MECPRRPRSGRRPCHDAPLSFEAVPTLLVRSILPSLLTEVTDPHYGAQGAPRLSFVFVGRRSLLVSVICTDLSAPGAGTIAGDAARRAPISSPTSPLRGRARQDSLLRPSLDAAIAGRTGLGLSSFNKSVAAARNRCHALLGSRPYCRAHPQETGKGPRLGTHRRYVAHLVRSWTAGRGSDKGKKTPRCHGRREKLVLLDPMTVMASMNYPRQASLGPGRQPTPSRGARLGGAGRCRPSRSGRRLSAPFAMVPLAVLPGCRPR